MRNICIILIVLIGVSQASAQKISKEELKDKIAGAWIGQMVGNIYGLPFENKFVDEPASESRFPFGYTKNLDKLQKYNGAFSDDDTDIEYMYLLLMEKCGVEPTYADIRDTWMYHVTDRVWLANRATLGLMHMGLTPPFTGNKDLNPHWYQIDPQLINEIWGYTAPGMIKYAAGKSDWAARITSDSWAVSPTVLYGAMYANAFFCKDVYQLIKEGLKELPADDRYALAVREMMDLYKKYPNDWVKVRQIMAKKYYIDEPAMTKTIWNANLNGLCGILAMLYGGGNFQHTLDLSCAMGFDCDNQAATISGLLGVMYGAKSLPKSLTEPIEGWTKPFNDRYINITRFDMPDASIEDMIERTYQKVLELVCAKGGKVKGDMVYINAKAQYVPPLEFCVGPNPDLEVGKATDYSFACKTNENFGWELIKGNLPENVTFKNGKLDGVPGKAGIYPITLQLSCGKKHITKKFNLLVKTPNIAQQADTIYANIRQLNEAVLDSCWITFGKPMYAKDVKVINDGVKNGVGSVFYSLAAKSKLPKIDYFGYGWKEKHVINMLTLNMGCLEEFGGWFTSLNIQYLGDDDHWYDIGKFKSTPELPKNDIVFFQPHFAQYVFSFGPVQTKGIRIIFDDKVQDHWHKYTKDVSSFISITELSVYESE
ncbi:MAG: ADP-ribosylglycohydrolase [Bacteroidetes bacterium]|nr:ADP-ribosylglycohydrolase [Bacteroidota bacterium]